MNEELNKLTLEDKIKLFKLGTEFELNGEYFIVTEELDYSNWIHYKYKDERTTKNSDIMQFMPYSKRFIEANIIKL